MAEEKKQEFLQEKWLKGVAITTTVLAVMTSIVSARSNTCTADTQLLTSEEAMKWQYYQSKSTRLQFIEVQRGLLRGEMARETDEAKKGSLFSQIKALNEESFKVDTKKGEIEKDARDVGVKRDRIARQGANFTLATVFFQIAIMLSSVSALVHRKALWLIGLCFGAVAIFFFVNGFFLFFQTSLFQLLIHRP